MIVRDPLRRTPIFLKRLFRHIFFENSCKSQIQDFCTSALSDADTKAAVDKKKKKKKSKNKDPEDNDPEDNDPENVDIIE
jgi:hypothetical protein